MVPKNINAEYYSGVMDKERGRMASGTIEEAIMPWQRA